jgi:hypothetical protein
MNTGIITGRWCDSTRWKKLEIFALAASGSCYQLTRTVSAFMAKAKNVQMQDKESLLNFRKNDIST